MDTISKGEFFGEWEQSKPLTGYDKAAQFVLGSNVLYRISHGGRNEQYGPNVLGSGGSAPKLAQVLREHFPVHRVSRVDACEDFYHRDAYDYLRAKALVIARDQKVKVREIVKPLSESDDGRTLYLGSSSTTQQRIYEKGKQEALDPLWVRAEIQVRPQKDVKQIAAYLSPLDVWAISKWSHRMAIELGNAGLKRINVQVYQQSDDDRAYRFMLKQYGNVLKRMQASHGSWETVGAQIGYDLVHIDDERDLKPPEAS